MTPILEELIHKGKARAMTHVWAISQVGSISIPQNHVAVITDVTIFPFINANNSIEARLAALMIRCLHRYVFESDKGVYNIVTRAGILSFISRDAPLTDLTGEQVCDLSLSGPYYFPQYQVHVGREIQLRVFEQTPPNQSALIQSEVMPARANEPVQPEGYAGVGVVQYVENFNSDMVYNPAGVRTRTSEGMKSPVSKDQWLDNLPASVDPNLPAGRQDAGQNHIVNIGYVLINNSDGIFIIPSF